MHHLITSVLTLYILLNAFLMSAIATPTNVVVHVLAKDAKLIGSGVGGVQVTIRNVETGEILDRGLHLGSTGNTDKIIKQPVEREGNRFDGDQDASFKTTLDIKEPTVVEIIAEGPMGYPHAMKKTSTEILLLPGQHLDREAVVLTINGFIVDIMTPESIDTIEAGTTFEVKTSLRLMCGCPTAPEGLWDSNQYLIKAYLFQNDQIVDENLMEFSGQTSIFKTEFTAPNDGSRGPLEIMIIASDPNKANFGMDKVLVGILSK